MKPPYPVTGTAGEPSEETLRQWLSELADGEADSASSEGACKAWSDRADMRQAWHSYHLIGDVMRSEDMSRSASGDADFLARLRSKLADEPVVMAPMPERPRPAVPLADPRLEAPQVAEPRRRRQGWLAPAAVAAGFVAVAGVLVVTRLSAPGADASAPLQARSAANPGLALAGTAAEASQANGAAMIRDAQLDAYLQAHQSMRGAGAATLPGGGLRSVEVVVPAGNGR